MLSPGGRNRIPVRVMRRPPEQGVDPLLQAGAQCVLQHLGLGVHLVPGHIQNLDQEPLQQPVPPYDAQRVPPPVLSEVHRMIRRAPDEPGSLQPLEHG